jgi:uracil-DNA glycosylase
VRWTERQRAMLREMGVRMWVREEALPVAARATAGDAARTIASTATLDRQPAAAAVPLREPAAARPEPGQVEGVPADWLVVGEPFGDTASAVASVAGEQERLLASMLHAVRVSRDAPARTGRASHVALGAGGGAPLRRALDQVRPRVALALGRAAAEALLGVDAPLGRLRGVVHEHDGVKVVVTFALAYLLRHPHEKAKAWADLCLAARALEGEPVRGV